MVNLKINYLLLVNNCLGCFLFFLFLYAIIIFKHYQLLLSSLRWKQLIKCIAEALTFHVLRGLNYLQQYGFPFGSLRPLLAKFTCFQAKIKHATTKIMRLKTNNAFFVLADEYTNSGR